ncbi:MAG: hypothetical protein L0154_17590 [Chloroflexi bacterium]|nr:hypothetical protein [Chloroflexota bacterium]
MSIVVALLLIPIGAYFYLFSGGPEPLYEDFDSSEQQANEYESAFAIAVRNAQTSGRFSVNVTDDQFASWLNLRFRDEFAEQTSLESLSGRMNFQALFDNNEARVFIRMDVISDLTFDTLVVLDIRPPTSQTPEGQAVEVDIKDLQFGRFGSSETLENDLKQAINNALTNLLAPLNGQYRIDSVSMTGGVLRIGGVATAS